MPEIRRPAATTLSLVLAFACFPTLAGAPPTLDVDPRSLPSLRVAWTSSHGAAHLRLADGVAYVLGRNQLSALDAGSGLPLWQYRIEPAAGRRRQPGLLILEDRIAVSDRDRLHLLDRASGTPVAVVAFDGPVQRLVGPPLTVWIRHESEHHELVRVDPTSGVELARRTVRGWIGELLAHRGMVVAATQDPNLEGSERLLGLDPGSLEVLWAQSLNVAELEVFGDELVASAYSDGLEELYAALEATSGELTYIPSRPWKEIEIDPGDEDAAAPASVLRRNDPATGEPLWRRSLPGWPGLRAREGDSLWVESRPQKGGRSLLVELDWNDGSIRRIANGLHYASALAVHGDRLLVSTPRRAIAYSLSDFDPPEAAVRSAAEEARRILALADRNRLYVRDAVADLTTLGGAVLPVIAALAPELGPRALQAAAAVLGNAGYEPAAPVLAGLLRGPAAAGSPSMAALLGALAQVGGRGEVAAVGEVLLDPGQDPTRRRQALGTLAAIDDPAAIEWMDRALAPRPDAPRAWWRPPAPHDGVEVAVSGAASGSASPPARWTVFPDAFLGGRTDLWLAGTGPDGQAEPALFLGVSIEGLAGSGIPDVALEAVLDGDALELSARGGASLTKRVDLAAVRRDRDGDGLTDLVESRLGSDPLRPDTDGDGRRDAEDPAPVARPAGPASEEEEIAAAAFRQLFTFAPPEQHAGLAVVRGLPALEWQGRGGPTLSLTDEALERFRRKAGTEGWKSIWVRPGDESHWSIEVAPGERFVQLYIDGQSHHLVMKKLGGRWVLRDVPGMSIACGMGPAAGPPLELEIDVLLAGGG